MEALKLTEQEQRAYSDLFQIYDFENSGKVSGIKAFELFRASGLSQDIIQQVTELCGAQRLGHFGRSQFYVALKLIAVAQCGLPLKFESFSQGMDIPLPRFSTIPEQDLRQIQSQNDARNITGVLQTFGQIPPPPTKHHVRSMSGTRIIQSAPANESVAVAQQNLQTTKDSTIVAAPAPGSPGQVSSPPAALPASSASSVQSEVNSLASSKSDLGWASFEEHAEEDHGLLGTGPQEENQWAYFHEQANKVDSSSRSSTCSDAESEEDLWSVSQDQRDYYENQFKTMQPDQSGVISGAVAKEFFEKSRLPVLELSKIWQLSDVDRDGALTLEEFCTAMHLVVLRRNDIALPEHLPPSLMPYTPLSDEPFAADLPPGSTLKRLTPSSPQSNQQWMFPIESQSSSAVSSPGIKPVQFDFKPVTDDGKIAHPVALRMSPDGNLTMEGKMDKTRTFSDPTAYEAMQDREMQQDVVLSPTKQRSFTESIVEAQTETQQTPAKLSTPLQARPRPTPKKPQPGNVTQIAPPPVALPVVPPRVNSAKEGAASSVQKRLINQASEPVLSAIDSDQLNQPDLEHVSQDASEEVRSAGDVFKRSISLDQSKHFQNAFSKQQAIDEVDSGKQSSSDGATELGAEKSQTTSQTIVQPHYMGSLRKTNKDKKDIQAAIRSQKERNTMLSRLNSELNQELQEVMEQRIALEIQLEHLKPFSSLH